MARGAAADVLTDRESVATPGRDRAKPRRQSPCGLGSVSGGRRVRIRLVGLCFAPRPCARGWRYARAAVSPCLVRASPGEMAAWSGLQGPTRRFPSRRKGGREIGCAAICDFFHMCGKNATPGPRATCWNCSGRFFIFAKGFSAWPYVWQRAPQQTGPPAHRQGAALAWPTVGKRRPRRRRQRHRRLVDVPLNRQCPLGVPGRRPAHGRRKPSGA